MKRLDLPPAEPAEQLAADEAVLDWCETGAGVETLIFWEPRQVFVVAGYANRLASEVNLAACAARGVPVFRRCSGGGTVVQLPGGLNYSLILRIDPTGDTRNITAANQFIMEKNRQAIERLASKSKMSDPNAKISVRGHTDLCLGEVKFAGNSQRRRKNFLLFHGTLLLDCELALISELLQMPTLQPDYRHGRPHAEFVINLNLPGEAVRAALAAAWRAEATLENPPLDTIKKLAAKYRTQEWNEKF